MTISLLIPSDRLNRLLGIFYYASQCLFCNRTGGERADTFPKGVAAGIALKWATILARREMGESLQVVSEDLGMPYETVKTYVKLARRALKSDK